MRKLYFLMLLATILGCRQSETLVPVPTETESDDISARVKAPVIVILGSSTAEGYGSSSYGKAWAGLFEKYLNTTKLVNLAKGGYTTYHMLPTGTPGKQHRPDVDTTRNITAALKRHPTILILSMTTNDVGNGYSVDEVMANLATVQKLALAKGVKRVLITTSMPRRLNTAATAAWQKQRDRTLSVYAGNGVNFFDPLAKTDGQFVDELTKDGVHPTDAGHQILFNKIVEVYSNPSLMKR